MARSPRDLVDTYPLAPTVVGSSPAMDHAVSVATRVAASNVKVLITGESGVGKDLIARHLHRCSVRSGHPFVAVNCAGLAETLLESELFGHEKGSFTGAFRTKPGKLQLAHRGTLFLDEVGEMSLRMQALLLRFLENGELQVVGGDSTATKVDVRVVAATNRHLPDLIAAGQFREDLLYRLRVIHLEVPPLRARPDDVRRLIAHFIERSGRRVTVTPEAMQLLERYRWPGNVRELQNVFEQTLWLSTGSVIDVEHLPEPIRNSAQRLLPTHERRTQVADLLYEALVSSGYSFWEHIYPLFLARDITRHDMRELVRRGLTVTRGNYRAMLKLFGMSPTDYKRFLNFLASHDCRADFREFRNGVPDMRARREPGLPGLPVKNPGTEASA